MLTVTAPGKSSSSPYLELTTGLLEYTGLLVMVRGLFGTYEMVCGRTTFSVRLCAQHEPNIKESTHIPMCCPSDLMHSHTNMQVPSKPCEEQGFGLIL